MKPNNIWTGRIVWIFSGQNVAVGRALVHRERGWHIKSDDRLDHSRRLRQVRRPGRQRTRKRLSFRFGRRRRYVDLHV